MYIHSLCLNCNLKKDKFYNFNDLSLEIPEGKIQISLYDLIKNIYEPKIIMQKCLNKDCINFY